MSGAEKWAASMSLPSYAIDDQTAIKVTDGTVEVVSEGHWKLFSRQSDGIALAAILRAARGGSSSRSLRAAPASRRRFDLSSRVMDV
jgi:hypothetical protein